MTEGGSCDVCQHEGADAGVLRDGAVGLHSLLCRLCLSLGDLEKGGRRDVVCGVCSLCSFCWC